MKTPPDDPLERSEESARDALRAIPSVSPDPAYRARMREAFISPSLAAPRRVPLRIWAMAASVLLALGWFASAANEGSPWRIVSGTGAGAVEIDGRATGRAGVVSGGAVVSPGALVETDVDAELVIASGDAIVLVVAPGSRVVLPDVPRRWLGRTLRARVEAGELRGKTGRDFIGARLLVQLPAAEVEITGTTFALIANDEGSCVCVFEGQVSMTERTGTFSVQPGRRRVVPLDGGLSRDEPLRSNEAMKLEMLVDQVTAMESSRSDQAP